MLTSVVCMIAFVTSADAVSLQMPDGNHRSVSTGKNELVRTVYQTGTLKDGPSKQLSMGEKKQARQDAEYEEFLERERAGCKWIIAVLPPLLLVAFVMYIRNAAEKASQAGAKDSWLNSFLRVNLIQQALAITGPENKTARGTEDNADLGKSLLSEVEEGGQEAITASSPLLQPIKEEEDEDGMDSSAKLFASLADSFHLEGLEDEDDFQVLPADAAVPSIDEIMETVDDSEWDTFQGAGEAAL